MQAREAIDLGRALGVTRTFASLLASRGHHDAEAARAFLDLRLADLTAPDAMADRAVAADRLATAVRGKERVVVFGDYDVDGITSAAIMTTVLRTLGAEVAPVLASRFDGGYGFSARALERVRALSPSLVVTCDCGSSDHPRLEDLRKAGIDAIVIDHHLVPKEPLPALAFLNPHRPECAFPFKHLASCGLALSIAAALRAKLAATLDLRPLLDLVALGTIADVAPLVGDNRALVKAGLARIATAPRIGIEAMAELCGIRPAAPVRGEDVSFRFAPRINAPGRLGSPDASLELLLETDRDRARALAARLEQACKERREIERKIFDEAVQQVAETGQIEAAGIVVAAQGWHFGVVGIVAARLVERFGAPVCAIALEGEHGRGSARGPEGARLHDALTRSRDALRGFGGHQAAAGMHLDASKVEEFRARFVEACRIIDEETGSRTRSKVGARYDAILDRTDEPHRVLLDLERFEPCGEGNRAPRLLIEGCEVREARVMKEEHLRLVVRHGQRSLDAFGFGLATTAPIPVVGSRIDLFGQLRRDDYRGRGAVEVRIESVRGAHG